MQKITNFSYFVYFFIAIIMFTRMWYWTGFTNVPGNDRQVDITEKSIN